MTPGTGRRLDIQGLRAIAVLMVVAFHARLPVPGGFAGVDVFFVISGFVITAMLQREIATAGRIRFGRFYLRRFKRLTPALALMVSCTVVASALLLSPLGTQLPATEAGLGAMLLAGNIVIARTTGGYWDPPAETNPLLNTWSLSVEEQFYLLFPVCLAACWLLGGRPRGGSWAVGRLAVLAIAVVSFGLAMLTASGYQPPRVPWLLGFYSPVTRAWEFAAGALLVLATTRRAAASRPVATVLGLLGAGMITASLWLAAGGVRYPDARALLPVAGAVLVILAGASGTNPVSRALSTRPLVRIGDWSYSIYLWHWPPIVLASLLWPDRPSAVLIAAAGSAVPALASYHLVEQPMRGMATPGLPRLAGVVAGVLAVPLVLSTALWYSTQHSFWSPAVRSYRAATLPWHAGLNARCDTAVPQSQRPSGECTWNRSMTAAPIYLVGDSNADQFSEGIIAAGAALNRPVVVSTTNACPFIDLSLRRLRATDRWNAQCHTYVHGTMRYLASSAPGLVIISATDTYWEDPDFVVGLTPQGETDDPDRKVAAMRTALDETVRTVQQAGHRVLLVQTIPRWTTWRIKSCTTFTVVAGACHQSMPVSDPQERQRVVRQAVDAVAGQTSAAVLDLWSVLCPRGTCSTETAGLVRYRDPGHISVPQSLALAPDFQRAIAQAG